MIIKFFSIIDNCNNIYLWFVPKMFINSEIKVMINFDMWHSCASDILVFQSYTDWYNGVDLMSLQPTDMTCHYTMITNIWYHYNPILCQWLAMFFYLGLEMYITIFLCSCILANWFFCSINYLYVQFLIKCGCFRIISLLTFIIITILQI